MENAGRRYDDEDKKREYERAMFQENKESGKSTWKVVDFSDKEKKESAIQGLKKFQTATGINEEPHIQDLDKAKGNWEIQKKLQKINAAGVEWYSIQLEESGVFEPIDHREVASMEAEKKGLIEAFARLPLSGNNMSKVDVLIRLKQDLEAKRQFRTRLKSQSKFIRDEYCRRLPSLALVGSRQDLLNNILQELKGLEKAPSAVQFEFKRRQNKSANVDTHKIKDEMMLEYKERAAKYQNQILANKDFFGGEDVNSKWGSLPLTAKEFMEWFEDRMNFAEMDAAIKSLPSLIKQRKELYKKRDEILDKASPQEKKKLTSLTDKMRRHELEEYLETLEESVQKNSIHVAIYVGQIITAKAQNVQLFNEFEQGQLTRRYKQEDLDTQEAKLKALNSDIRERQEVVNDYLALPRHLRRDEQFIHAHHMTRIQMLEQAQNRLDKEPKSAFDTSKMQLVAANDTRAFAEALDESEGDNMMNEVVDELEQEGEVNDLLGQTFKKIYGTQSVRGSQKPDKDQKDLYLDDLRFWIKLNRGVEDESDVSNEKERAKVRFMEAADQGYDLGYVMNSGGIVQDLQEIDETDLLNNNQLAKERVKRARYGEHVRVNHADGRMSDDPLELIEKLSERELQRLVMLAIVKLAQGQLGLGESGSMGMKNSAAIQESVREHLIAKEHAFSHLKAT